MSSKILSKLFWIFSFLCFLLIIQSRAPHSTPTKVIKEPQTVNEKTTGHSHPLFYAAYQKVLIENDDTKKLIAISKALQIAKSENFEDGRILQDLNIVAANIHQSRWHIVYALENYKAAQRHIYDRNINKKIKELRTYLAKVEAERSLNDDYIATKFSGPAKKFRGRVLVTYVFVDEGINTRWSNKTKLRSQQIMSLVQEWQTKKAAQYGVADIEFINKTFVARRNPNLKASKAVTFTSSSTEIEQFVLAVAKNLGENSIGEFIEKQMRNVGADQGVVFLHTNLDQRSFAQRCGYTHKKEVYQNGKIETYMLSQCRDEYVMLMEKVKRNRWDKMHYAQAHEMMHVFGAADLYNIKNASNYAVTDIMNFQSRLLVDSSVEPITAYAIGWREEPPLAPFDILEK